MLKEPQLSLTSHRESALPVPAPSQRGRLLSTEEIRQEIYRGQKSLWWITHNFAPEYKIKQGRDCFWWEADAFRWLDEHRAIA